MKFRDEWHNLKQWLDGGPERNFKNQYINRFVTILKANNYGLMDLVVAARDVLCAAVIHKMENPKLYVSDKLSALNALELKQVHLILTQDKHVRFLPGYQLPEQYVSTYKLERRRFLSQATMDLSLKRRLDLKFDSYLGAGQQSAVRCALLAEPGRTIVINLPTGCGKTLVIQALMGFAGSFGLTLVVVPTIALAIEQAEEASKLLKVMKTGHDGPYSWRAALSDDDKQKIKDRISRGEQRILFCSPESIYRGLFQSLQNAAKNGVLRNLVIDEAHLVEQWGADFRPEYQILVAALKRFHLDSSSDQGIKTVLLSATIRASTLGLFDRLFPDPTGKPILVYGAFLRPEINFEVHKTNNPSQHGKMVEKKLFEMPRPLILYCSERDEVKSWGAWLQKKRFKRYAEFTGDTPDATKAELVRKWGNDEFDIMVATKAFGVGMDKQTIRSVLRASIPENLDLFYQEAGRAGRDGVACNASLVFHNSQKQMAKQLNNEKLITWQLGRPRWQAMWQNKKALGSLKYRIDLTTVPPKKEFSGKLNWEWNWKTLLLMQRAKVLEIELLDPSSPKLQSPDEVNTSPDRQISERIRYVAVKSLIGAHSKKDTWQGAIATARNVEKIQQSTGHEEIIDWLDQPEVSLCHRLRSFYSIGENEPEYNCGGCPGCKKENIDPENIREIAKTASVTSFINPVHESSSTLSCTSQLVYFTTPNDNRALLRSWAQAGGVVSKLITKGLVNGIRTNKKELSYLNKRLPSGMDKFWVSLEPNDCPSIPLLELRIGFYDDPQASQILNHDGDGLSFGDQRITASDASGRKWFESNSDSLSLEVFSNLLENNE